MPGIPEIAGYYRDESQGDFHDAEPGLLPSKPRQMQRQMEREWNSVSSLRLDRTPDSEKPTSTNC